MMGANRLQTFRRVLLPLTLPGLLTAGILVLVVILPIQRLSREVKL